MSRIENILKKAEREGTVHRVRAVAEPAPAALAPYDQETRVTVTIAPTTDEALEGAASAVAPAVTSRTVSGTRLHPTLVTALTPEAAASEQYRGLRTRVLHADHGAVMHMLLVTSPGPGEGKSVTAANLALTMGQEIQQRVCVVDANLRAPQLHKLFGLPEGPGLADVVSGRATLADALVTLEDYQITVLPAGAAAHPAELLGSSAMRRTLETLRTQFDRVVIDAPSAAPLADVGILSPMVDGVLLVVRAGVTSKPAVHEAIGSIDPSKLVGAVLNEAVSA